LEQLSEGGGPRLWEVLSYHEDENESVLVGIVLLREEQLGELLQQLEVDLVDLGFAGKLVVARVQDVHYGLKQPEPSGLVLCLHEKGEELW
jgi:hypothetical protein